MMALLALPLARKVTGELASLDRALSKVTADMLSARESHEDAELLTGLSRIARDVEEISSRTSYRFSAARACGPRKPMRAETDLAARQFRRPEGDEIQQGTVSGFGDLSLVAAWNFFRTGDGSQAAEAGPGVLAAANAAPDAAVRW